MRTIRLLSVILLATLAGGFVAQWYAVPTAVNHAVVEPRIMALGVVGPGLLDATNKVVITARIPGFLVSIGADKNDRVKKGQVLAQLESADLRNQLLAARSDADAARIAIMEAERERDRANASFGRAKLDFERKATLLKTNVTSQAEFLNSEAAMKEAQAQFARTTVAIERAQAQAASAGANVEVLQAKLAEATIRSPIDGVVVSRDRNVGDLLAPGTALMHIVDPASIVISARFDESTMDSIRPGQAAKVRFASSPDSPLEGEVLRLTRQVDRETREYTADITLKSLPENWAMSQRAAVAIEAQPPGPIIAIPKDFLARYDGRAGVWLERGGRATWLPVALGYVGGSNIQITHGLAAGDVVLDPRGRYPFQPVVLAREPS